MRPSSLHAKIVFAREVLFIDPQDLLGDCQCRVIIGTVILLRSGQLLHESL